MNAALLLAVLSLSTPTAAAEPAVERFERAWRLVSERIEAVDALDRPIPGRLLVAVGPGGAVRIDAQGVADLGTGAPVDADTPFYVASMTKPFVGLLAVELDRRGVFALDGTLAEHFPDLEIDGVDESALTFRRLLSHRGGFRAVPLNIRMAYTDAVPPAEVPAVVNASAEPTGEGFAYNNIGYLLYGAALEKRTGKSWKAWLDDLVLAPLGMADSSARTSDLPRTSSTHERLEDGWEIYPPKADRIMHAAGGLVVSGRDLARWLAANAGAETPVPRAAFETAQRDLVETKRRFGGIECTGYGLGWAHCSALGVSFLEHGGQYAGMRGEMIVLPGRSLGFAAIFNSDTATSALAAHLIEVFVAGISGREDELPSPEEFAARHDGFASRHSAAQTRRRDEAFAEAGIGMGEWPPAAELLPVTGRYRHPAMGELAIHLAEGKLAGTLNGTGLRVEPGSRGRMLARIDTWAEWTPFVVHRDDGGRVVAVEYAGDRYDRLP